MSEAHPHSCPSCASVSRRAFGKGLLATASVAALAACEANPVTGRSSFGTIQDDVSTGKREHPGILQAFGGEYDDPRMAGFVQKLGLSIASKTEFPNLPYHFTVLNTPIVNAFALPGGYVYLTRGLLALASDEAEVAGVLGHEIGHVTARHSAERQTQSMVAQLGLILLGAATGSGSLVDMAQVGAAAYLQSYSRDQEFEADTLGVRYMTLGGYDPQGMVTFLASLREYSQLEARMSGQDPNTVDQYNMMASHPRTIDRVERAMAAADVAQPQNPIVGRNEYLQQIDGMLYGDDPRQGVIDGQAFRHPGLRFAFQVPEGFRLFNGDNEVTAQNPKGAAIVFDMAQTGTQDLAAYLVDDWGKGLQMRDVERITVNGLAGATGWTRGKTRSGAEVELRAVALQGDGRRVFRFLFLSPAQQASQWTTAFRETTYSFRRLSQQEASQIRGFRLIVVPAAQGDSVARLAKTMPFGSYNEAAFRVLNDLPANGEVQQGQLVKVITS